MLGDLKVFFSHDPFILNMLNNLKIKKENNGNYMFLFPEHYSFFEDFIRASLEVYFRTHALEEEFDLRFCSEHRYICENCNGI